MIFVRAGRFQLSQLNDYQHNALNYLTRNEFNRLNQRSSLPQMQSLVARHLIFQQLSCFDSTISQFEVRLAGNSLTLSSGNKSLPYSCSISHSGEWIAVALSSLPSIRLGIDIEVAKPKRDFIAMSREYFSAAEHREIVNSSTKALTFYSLWTLKEAYAKAQQKALWDVVSENVEPEGNGLHSFQAQIEGSYLTCVTEANMHVELNVVDLLEGL